MWIHLYLLKRAPTALVAKRAYYHLHRLLVSIGELAVHIRAMSHGLVIILTMLHHSLHLGDIVHQHVFNPIFQRGRGGRASRTRALHLQVDKTHPFIEAMVCDISAIFLHRRADPSVEQLFDHLHNLAIVFMNLSSAGLNRVRIRHDWLVGSEKVHDRGEHFGLQNCPLDVLDFGHCDEIGPEEHRADAIVFEQLAGEWGFHPVPAVREVGTPGFHDGTSGDKHQAIRVRGSLGLNKHASPLDVRGA
mmetsp:Transcript_39959/g.67014  ORF Transcript_39959/g.67014 Transcript_39959/m.67014 type:complete len:247 (+) Transcript_39959:185-925(+)